MEIPDEDQNEDDIDSISMSPASSRMNVGNQNVYEKRIVTGILKKDQEEKKSGKKKGSRIFELS